MALIDQTPREYYEGADGIQNNGNGDYGSYQFTSIKDIISNFLLSYVGEDKLIPKIKRMDVSFHAQRALQELSFDTFKSTKSYELEVPATLTLPLPQDYVNYTKISSIDSAGIKKILYPISKTSNPTSYQQDSDGKLKFEDNIYVKTNQSGTDIYTEYGLTSRDKDGNYIGKTSREGEFKSEVPLEKFVDETRVNVTGETRVNPGNGNNNTNYLFYGGGGALDMKILFHGDYPNIKVGQSVFGPGIPENTTVASVFQTTGGNYRGTSITMTNPKYEADKLRANPTGASGRPTGFMVKNTQVIIVDLNKQSDSWKNYKGNSSGENNKDNSRFNLQSGRYGIDPEFAQSNGSYYIDNNTGLIHFSSFMSGKTVVVDYLSDSLGTESEMKVHKFAEDAMYKCIAYAIMSTRANVQEYIVRRFQKDKFASVRKAKLRLSNLKLEELSQNLRGKSKQIKH
tara:strand:+ start:665 stop:2029 length:1365 start_codon:yes stop_codon:yes gene_type:complete